MSRQIFCASRIQIVTLLYILERETEISKFVTSSLNKPRRLRPKRKTYTTSSIAETRGVSRPFSSYPSVVIILKTRKIKRRIIVPASLLNFS